MTFTTGERIMSNIPMTFTTGERTISNTYVTTMRGKRLVSNSPYDTFTRSEKTVRHLWTVTFIHYKICQSTYLYSMTRQE